MGRVKTFRPNPRELGYVVFDPHAQSVSWPVLDSLRNPPEHHHDATSISDFVRRCRYRTSVLVRCACGY